MAVDQEFDLRVKFLREQVDKVWVVEDDINHVRGGGHHTDMVCRL